MPSTSSVSPGTSTTAPATTAITASDPASIGSALATALGGGTGVDMTQLASNIAGAEFAGQISNITARQAALTTQISSASQLMSDLGTLANSFNNQLQSGNLSASPTVANGAVATATLPAGENGAASSYSLEVDRLAAAQVLASPGYGSTGAITGSGMLTINTGTIANGTFTPGTGQSPVVITIPSGATLSDVAQAINGSGAGVTAYVATTATGAQLVLKGAQRAASAFTVSASENAGDPGLSALAWEPATGSPARLTENAADASYKLDGVALTSPGNAIASAAPGLSLQLTETNAGNPTTITYSNPLPNIGSEMTNFTTALNAIVSEMNTDMTPGTGSLRSDLAAQSLRHQLSQLPGMTVMPGAPPGTPATLADLGLSVHQDGSFALDGKVLQAALQAHPTAVAAMFTTGINGVYNTLDSLVINATASGTPSSLTYSVSSYTADQTSLATQLAKLQTQESALRTQLVTQYAATNALVAANKSTLSYLTAQIAAWTNQASSSR
jgi:flagellar hook-associated protein 2